MLSFSATAKEPTRVSQEVLPIELVREFVIAGHFDLEKVKRMHHEHPALLNAFYQWKEDDHETAIQAAAQTGNVAIAEYLLANGAPLEICTAAMLGRTDDVKRILAWNAKDIDSTGAHGIPLLAHAALSGNLDIVQLLFNKGAHQGISFAFHNAVSRNNYQMARWLLETGNVDLGWKNYQGKTALEVASEKGYHEVVDLLKHGGTAQSMGSAKKST